MGEYTTEKKRTGDRKTADAYCESFGNIQTHLVGIQPGGAKRDAYLHRGCNI